MTKEELYVLLTTKKVDGGISGIHESGFAKKFPEIYKELEKFPKDFTFRQKLYHYVKDDFELNLGKCKHCGKRTAFVDLYIGYLAYCCRTCAQRDFVELDKQGIIKRVVGFAQNPNHEKAKKTCLERYGVENPQQVKSINEKSLNTKHERYGDNFEEITKKTKKTKKEKYGDENYNNQEKAKKTCLDKYGAENVYASEYGKQKIKKTNNERYGVDHAMKNKQISKKMVETKNKYSEERKQKVKQKYKLTWSMKTPEEINLFVEKIKNTKNELYGDENFNNREKFKNTCISLHGGVGYASKEINEKARHTMINEYGVEHNSYVPSVIESRKISYEKTRNTQEHLSKIKQAYERLYNKYIETGLTPKGGLSKIELDFNTYLIDAFGKENVIQQYYSKEYPFYCDFYLKTFDLYIELNAHWTHGNHAFDNTSKEDLDKVNCWKSKNKKYYDNAIKTWTINDVQKRNTAKENHLNYLELFSNNLEDLIVALAQYIQNFI